MRPEIEGGQLAAELAALRPPAEYHEVDSTSVPGSSSRPPAPGGESAGPPLTMLDFQTSLERMLERLLERDARQRSGYRYYEAVIPFATDASGNAAVKLFEVPAGALGSLVLVAVDEAGVTPQSPDTRATLSLELVIGSAGTTLSASVGELVDCLPQTPGVAAQIPSTFNYGDKETSPRTTGPRAFWLVVQNANASKQCAARIGVCVDRNGEA